MMRLRSCLALLALAPAVVAATSAGDCRDLSGGGATTVEVCEATGWFEPSGDARVGNLGGLATAAGQSEPALPTWGPEPPDASATEGAGALHTAHAGAAQSDDAAHGIAGARFEGTFTGNLDTVALDVYMVTSHEFDEYLPPGSGHASRSCQGAMACEGIYPVLLTLEIDGREIDLGEVDAYLYPPSTGGNILAMRFRVAVTGLFDGHDDPSAVHDVAVEVVPHEGETTLLFDATEWPSKILFNPADTTSYSVVPADHDHHDHDA